MNLPNPYTLIGVSLLVVIALTQYFAIRSENVVLEVQITELKQQLRDLSILQAFAEHRRKRALHEDICKARDKKITV